MTLADDQTANNTYTVLARRYRPTRFEDCVGQEHVSQALRNAIQSNRVAHAYLFCGSRGVGKTSMARIFARALNCVQGPTAHPCGECESCLAIAAGSDLDVVEIDGASNRGIDEIRELRQGVSYRPSRSRYKIYIIDEVHMLTKEAFNALLKTLEEPPAHVKFVFATTEAQKIPITILSRCQRYDFAGIGLDQIAKRLAEIVQSEGMTAEPEAIEIIARRARGSMRDSQSLLDQVLAYASGQLTSQTVHKLLGTAGEERVFGLAQSILAADAPQCLRLVDDAVGEGVQLGEWIEQMLDYFRDLMVLAVDESAALLSMPNRLRASMLEQAQNLQLPRILEMMDILAACRTRLRASTFGRTLIEMTLVRLCRLDEFVSLASLLSSPPAMVPTPSPSPRPPAPADSHAKKNGSHDNSNGVTSKVTPAPPPLSSPVSPPQPSPPTVRLEFCEENRAKIWQQVQERISDTFLVAMLSQLAGIGIEAPATLILRFPPGAGVSRTHCEEKAPQIRAACEIVTGCSVTLRFEDAKESGEAPKRPHFRSQSDLRAEASKDPIVKEAEELLGARIVGEVEAMAVAPPSVTPAPISETTEEELDRA